MDTARDIMIILVSVFGTIFFVTMVIALAFIAFSIKGLVRDIKGLVDEEVKPTLRAARDSMNSVKGAAAVATSVGAASAGGSAFRAVGLAMTARRVLGMVRSRNKK